MNWLRLTVCLLVLTAACQGARPEPPSAEQRARADRLLDEAAALSPPNGPRADDAAARALALLQQALAAAPGYDRSLAAMGQWHLRQYQDCLSSHLHGDLRDCDAAGKEVLRYFEDTLRVNPNQPQALAGLAYHYHYRWRDFDRALDYYRRLSALEPDNPQRLIDLGKALLEKKQYDPAAETFNRVIALAGNTEPQWLRRAGEEWLGRTYMAQGKYELAEKTLRRAAADLEDFNQQQETYWGCPYQALGELYARLGRPDQIVVNYKKAADLEAVKDVPQYMAAYACYVAGDYPQAEHYIDRALALNRLADYLTLKGHLRLLRRQYVEAEKIFRDALAGEPGNHGAEVGLGHLRIIAKQYEEATALFKPALASTQIDPESAEFWQSPTLVSEWFAYHMACLGLGWTMANQNRHPEAIGFYDRILKRQPLDLMALLGKGVSLSGLQRLSEAEELFNLVLRQYPNNQYALAEIALVKYNRGDTAGAEAAFQQALAQGDTQYTCHYEGLGLVYLRQGKFADAKTNFEKAIAINPDIEYKKFNGLAKIYLREGKVEEARNLLRKSVANYPYDNEAKEMLTRLESSPANP